MSTVRQRTARVNDVELQLLESGDAGAPLVILSHGFPEGAYSWRHQMEPLAAAGYHVVAPDQRGYGRSSCPTNVTDYGIGPLTADLLGLADEAGAEQAIFVGHDWGALIVWDMALLHPERTRAVVGVSVPLTRWPMKPTELFSMMFGDRFFYISYFQEVGPADAELGADPYRTMAKTLWSASGNSNIEPPAELPPMQGTGFLTMMEDPPAELPGWLTDEDIKAYADNFAVSGFFGPLSYYRNLDANYELEKDLDPMTRITMPSFFIGGDKDMVIARNPGAIDTMKSQLPDFRGGVLLPGIGHWTQQEAPSAFNDALLGYLKMI